MLTTERGDHVETEGTPRPWDSVKLDGTPRPRGTIKLTSVQESVPPPVEDS